MVLAVSCYQAGTGRLVRLEGRINAAKCRGVPEENQPFTFQHDKDTAGVVLGQLYGSPQVVKLPTFGSAKLVET